MEKKTLGSFIAVLRKSQGMTQKELAERLGVSDKTISHWERDESSPDISLIPVIAEIFDVTCDELLRGEKSESTNKNSTECNIKKISLNKTDMQDFYFNISKMCSIADFLYAKFKNNESLSTAN